MTPKKAGRPSINPAEKAQKVGYSLKPALIEYVERQAHEKSMSASAFVGSLIERHMDACAEPATQDAGRLDKIEQRLEAVERKVGQSGPT